MVNMLKLYEADALVLHALCLSSYPSYLKSHSRGYVKAWIFVGGITVEIPAVVLVEAINWLASQLSVLYGKANRRFIKERKEKEQTAEVVVATKFAALPWRLGRESVIATLKDSFSRLGLSSVELYQLHWSAFLQENIHLKIHLRGLEAEYTLHNSSQRFIKERKEKEQTVEVAVATKFAALPWRLGRESVVVALKDSFSRLGLSSVELYQLHWSVAISYIFFFSITDHSED
ncbi:hypothetical protein IFM89_020892 [Coptis chinensis]|uniref:Uncharacterized protein n=1 Tax=Coptis chinensis TaxID=261450 RepID=A0A835HV98_9MAGN|nr:hypothetical protein IFM89_020892 [Coptis chinensis]